MTAPTCTGRDLLFLTTPALWPAWPFLPVVRRTPDTPGALELGVLIDTPVFGLTGYRVTVFKCNVFDPPPTLDAFLALPKEVFDTAEELLASGWRVD